VIQAALIVALATLAVGLALAYALKLLPTIRLRLVGLAVVGVVLPLGAVLLSGWVMFHMGDDLKILAVTAASALTALVAALFVAEAIADAVDAVRGASARFAAGDLDARSPENGPRETAELAVSFNEMASNLQRLFDTRSELVAWASHDLRTPLANLQAMTEALEDGLAEPEEFAPLVREQVRVLTQLVDDLFELVRLEAADLTLDLHRMPVAPVVSRSLCSVEREAGLRQIRLVADVDETTMALFAADKIERVLMNLLTNAMRHTPSDGAVAIRASKTANAVEISVEDTGDGFDATTQVRMFEPFWRADASRSDRRAGLGLAIARGLVEAHGGRMWAEQRPGGGARISFTLPDSEGRPSAADAPV
jgi:signal transduction histidine kinase